MLSAILARLVAQTTSFQVIAQAPSGAAITTVDAAAASAALKTILVTAVTQVYSVEALDGKKPAAGSGDAVYRLAAANAVEVEGVRVITAVSFVVTIRATSYADLTVALSAIETAINGSDGAISITDAAMDFDDTKNYFLAALEVLYAVPAVSGGDDWPALLVDAEEFVATPSAYDNIVKQWVSRRYSFTLISTTNNMNTLRTELQNSLLGWQQDSADYEFQFVSGAAVNLPGGLYAWRDTYADSTLIQQP